jgi:hypothetical protein
MSDIQLPEEESFEPEVLEAMRTAYRMARESAQLENAAESTTEILVEKIIELAEAGETDPARLCNSALRRLLH